MLNKFLCWIFGCKLVSQSFTGEQFDTIHPLTGQPTKGNYYKMVQNKFCHRCSKPNKHYGTVAT